MEETEVRERGKKNREDDERNLDGIINVFRTNRTYYYTSQWYTTSSGIHAAI